MPEGTPDHDGDEDGGMPEDQEPDPVTTQCPTPADVERARTEYLG